MSLRPAALPYNARHLCSRAQRQPLCALEVTRRLQLRNLSANGALSRSVSSESSASNAHRISLPSLPAFPAHGTNVQVLHEPTEFYSHLLSSIRRAKRRIFFASLYIGKEEVELIQTLHDALKASPKLEVHLLVDYLRSTREHPKKSSSASLLAGLQAAFPKRVQVSLYHTPALSGLLKSVVPKRYNEGWGLWHGKVYGFDDEVVLSGANLSRDYFTNRQDRYIAVKDHPALADYMHSLLQRFATLSFSLHGRSSASSTDPDNLDLTWQTLQPKHISPLYDASRFTAQAKETLQTFIKGYTAKREEELSAAHITSQETDTVLQPFLQMGPFDIRQETEVVVPAILQEAADGSNMQIDWTSGYFSLRRPYKDGLLAANGPVRIVCAAPEANGFYQSAGFSKYIPPAYTYLERRFYSEVQKADTAKAVELYEWKRLGWTYHAKGIWITPSGSSKPTMTLVGSSNYGSRSAVRDLEINLAIQTTSSTLQAALGKELDNILLHADDRVNEALFERKDRHVGIINRIAARAISDML